jgi:hypothetical protein
MSRIVDGNLEFDGKRGPETVEVLLWLEQHAWSPSQAARCRERRLRLESTTPRKGVADPAIGAIASTDG